MKTIIVVITAIVLVLSLCHTTVGFDSNVIQFKRSDDEVVIDESLSVCPNNRTKCSQDQTCCKTKHNSYHCCRYRNAVCCSDRYHCCPEGSTCDLKQKKCNRNSVTKEISEFQLPREPMEWKVSKDLERVQESCPNNKTKCKDTQTCCLTKRGNYHCCKFQNAVCCSDKYHCCPEGSTCDLKRKRCNKNVIQGMLSLTKPEIDAVEPKKMWSVDDEPFCPNNKTQCKATKTCCITKHGNYYCCPHKNAVCCSDKWSCCPEGSTCDVKNKRCNNNNWQRIMPLQSSDTLFVGDSSPIVERPAEKTIDEEPFCPNNKSRCKATKTCCITKHGNYYCCPHKNAVCCSDKWSCCPEGSTCDVKNKRCNNNDWQRIMPLQNSDTLFVGDSSPIVERPAEKTIDEEPFCPNNKSRCKATKTCCITKHGNYYCCPHKNAVCCSDKWSCCPEGSTCDVKNKKCVNNAYSRKTIVEQATELEPTSQKSSLMELFLTFFLNLEKNCGNLNTGCANNGKCCPMENGAFGCCKYKSGSCCPDRTNCCPSGTRCQDGGCVGL